MKAMILTEYGDQAAFEAADLPTPTAQAGEVLVRVAATSVNTVDTMIREIGADLPLSPALPAILTMDVAGVVEAIGDGVTAFKPGDEVYGCVGGLADFLSQRLDRGFRLGGVAVEHHHTRALREQRSRGLKAEGQAGECRPALHVPSCLPGHCAKPWKTGLSHPTVRLQPQPRARHVCPSGYF